MWNEWLLGVSLAALTGAIFVAEQLEADAGALLSLDVDEDTASETRYVGLEWPLYLVAGLAGAFACARVVIAQREPDARRALVTDSPALCANATLLLLLVGAVLALCARAGGALGSWKLGFGLLLAAEIWSLLFVLVVRGGVFEDVPHTYAYAALCCRTLGAGSGAARDESPDLPIFLGNVRGAGVGSRATDLWNGAANTLVALLVIVATGLLFDVAQHGTSSHGFYYVTCAALIVFVAQCTLRAGVLLQAAVAAGGAGAGGAATPATALSPKRAAAVPSLAIALTPAVLAGAALLALIFVLRTHTMVAVRAHATFGWLYAALALLAAWFGLASCFGWRRPASAPLEPSAGTAAAADTMKVDW